MCARLLCGGAGLLAQHVEEILALGEDVRPYLTSQSCLTLLAVARRRVRRTPFPRQRRWPAGPTS